MYPIPDPQVLDPNRPLANDRGGFGTADDDRRGADLLEKALHETCAYARQLWDNVNAVREYLMDSLPPDPRSPGPHPRTGAAPTGPDDEEGWARWIAAYASVTSVLCGPQGDSGFGLHEAREAAQLRRTAPVLHLFAAHPELGDGADSAAGAEPDPPGSAKIPDGHGAIRSALTAALVLLALRGLRPRRRRAL